MGMVRLMQYCTVDDVYELTGADYRHWFKDEFSKEEDMKKMVLRWIQDSSEIITKYCNQEWNNIEDEKPEKPVPLSVRLATSIIVTNIMTFAQKRREIGLIRRDDWNKKYTTDNEFIFDDNVKNLLKPYKLCGETVVKNIKIYSVSGRKEGK